MKDKHILFAIIMLLLSAALACNLPSAGQRDNTLTEGMIEDYSLAADAELDNDFTYSDDQLDVQRAYGSPTRFTILFGKKTRQETWFYDTAGYAVVFRDGEKVSEQRVTPQYQEDMYATTYSPDQFYEGMELDEIVLSTRQHDFILTNIEGMAEDGQLIHMEGLIIGLLDEEIGFVETYPAMTEIKLEPDGFAPQTQLTPEETTNEGTHDYLIVYYLDGDEFEEEIGTVEVTFLDDRLSVE